MNKNSFSEPGAHCIGRDLVAVLATSRDVDADHVVHRLRLERIDIGVGEHVVRWSDQGAQIVSGVADRGKRFEARHGIRVPRIARRRAEEEGADTLLVGERRRSRRLPSAIRRDQDCAPLSWTSEGADTLFVCE
jgi:hypothetical protein